MSESKESNQNLSDDNGETYNDQIQGMAGNNNEDNTGYVLTPVQSDPIIPITAINSFVANTTGETRATIEPSVESSATSGKKPQIMVEINPKDWRTLCLILFCIFLLTFISIGLSFSSVSRKEKNLAMERSSYWWYFLYSLLVLIIVLNISMGLLIMPQIHKTLLLWFTILVFIILLIELILFTRFFFVTFPMTELNWNLEPIVFIGISSLRFTSNLVLVSYIIKYLNSISSNSTSNSSKGRTQHNHKHQGK